MILVNENGIYVVEIKDFYGQVYSSGDAAGNYTEWIQKARPKEEGSRNHVYIKHGDLLGEIILKAKAVANYLMQTPIPAHVEGMFENGNAAITTSKRELKRLILPPGKIYPCLVFVNPQCLVDHDTLKRHQFVFTAETFKKFVGQRSVVYDWGAWLAPMIVSASNLTYNQQLATLAIVDTLPTWDTITFHNGSVRTGDVLSVHFPDDRVGQNAVVPFVERKQIAEIFVTWPGLSTWGLLWTICTRSNLPTIYLRLKPSVRLDTQPKLAKRVISGASAESVSQSAAANNAVGARSTRRGTISDEDAAVSNSSQMAMLACPIGSNPGEPLRSEKVVYLKFKSAGQSEAETIAVHHLASISLSPVSVHTHGRPHLPGDKR